MIPPVVDNLEANRALLREIDATAKYAAVEIELLINLEPLNTTLPIH
jgi:hypothetical protein